MSHPKKTVFISYRRKDISWALAVYHYLTKHDYDVFFDYKSIPSGDFEQIIVGNIKARAHFLVILTPTALDRANEPGDWLRREIENAISERRNIIPLFFDGFNFGVPSVSEKLTGKLGRLKRYNGLEVPAGYFDEAMDRLCGRYLNVTLDAVLHPVSEEVQKAVKEQQVAANQAISSKAEIEEKARKEKDAEKRTHIAAELKAKKEQEEKERRQAEEKARKEEKRQARRATLERTRKRVVETLSGMFTTGKSFFQRINPKQYGIGGIVVLALLILIYGGNYFSQNLPSLNMPDTRNTPIITPAIFPIIASTSTVEITSTMTQTKTPLPTPTIGIDTMVSPIDDMTMVYVPAGNFEMGSENSSADSDYEPIHTVYLDAYWIDQTEVTNAMFARYMNLQETQSDEYIFWLDTRSRRERINEDYDLRINLNEGKWAVDPGYENHPVVRVNWDVASDYCTWVGRRLPTEAEWEKAARGEKSYIYPWGDGQPNNNLLNYNDAVGDTTEVDRYPSGASPYGALDMAGNVREWVSDNYEYYYYRNSPASNPQGSSLLPGTKAIRGSSFDSNPDSILSFYRGFGNGGLELRDSLGFRCAMDAE